jgi:hypothetical protein
MSNKLSLDATECVEIKIPIQGKSYTVVSCELRIDDLCFFTSNPRIYSALHKGGGEPTQADIQEHLQKMDHVVVLRDDIKQNGGLLEPVLVKEATKEVVEGNSRLAAYRLLAAVNPLQWARMRALVLPKNVSDSDISSILSQLHLKGKLNWTPYEQAGHIWRRRNVDKISLPELCREVKLSRPTVTHRMDVIEYMIEHNDNTIDHWSHYDVMLKSKNIQKAFQDHADLEEAMVDRIKSGKIKAVEIRDKFKVICSTKGDKPVKMFLEGKSIDAAFEVAQTLGGDNHVLQKLTKFRESISAVDTKRSVADANPKIRSQLAWELEQIRAKIAILVKAAKSRKA